jgi:hypothetical protein
LVVPGFVDALLDSTAFYQAHGHCTEGKRKAKLWWCLIVGISRRFASIDQPDVDLVKR